MIIGYASVSSKSTKLSSNIADLEAFGCEKIIHEKQSDINYKDRSVYNEMRTCLNVGDVLVFRDLSSLGRSKREIKDEWKELIKEEIEITVLEMPIIGTNKYKNLD